MKPPAIPPTTAPSALPPDTRPVPYDLIQATVSILLNLSVAQGYVLMKRWEEVCPELFQTGDQG